MTAVDVLVGIVAGIFIFMFVFGIYLHIRGTLCPKCGAKCVETSPEIFICPKCKKEYHWL